MAGNHQEVARAAFELPMNWSDETTEFILAHRDNIWTVYGSLPGEAGGRPIPHSPELHGSGLPDERKRRLLVKRLTKAGLSFNLAINASCYGNSLFTEAGKKWVSEQVGLLADLGIEWVTVASFDLARRISAQAPQVKILLSVMFNITELDAVAYAIKQDFNLGGIILGKGLTRKTSQLRRIVRFMRSRGLHPVVIANDFCPTANCPERMSDHNNACAHYHDFPFEYVSPSIHCRRMSMADPAHYLQAAVINPNDLRFYEDLGVRHFKLTDRVMPHATLRSVCEAYFAREYDGNLFDLFTYTSYLGKKPPDRRELTDSEIVDIYNGGYQALKRSRAYFVCQPRADARDLSTPNGFFQFFAEGRCTMQCGSKRHEIPGCSHCEDYAERMLVFDQDEWRAVQSNIERYIAVSRLPRAAGTERLPVIQGRGGSSPAVIAEAEE